MIVKILSNGKSFSGLATYLSHDAEQAKSTERVDWTHTLNCANEDVPCAVNEMLWTARDAELLKQEAGIRAGGRATENTVKHFSLSWSPEEKPTQEHMIETTQDFLRHMKWEEHQAVLFSHTDKPYAHVHCMLNTVHPETGLRLNDSYEQVRAQEWALKYEREHGIYCEQRLLNPEERERNPPRNIWMEFWVNQKEFEKAEKSLRENQPIYSDDAKIRQNSEWQILKQIQRSERMDFFAEGKSEFSALRNSIYREIREEFRGRWADYYSAKENGADPETLATLKAELVADQKGVLEARRDEACKELRASRDEQYRGLLDDQREFRAHLRSCQDAGLDNMPLLLPLTQRDATQDISTAFREAAEVTTRLADDGSRGDSTTSATTRHDDSSAGGADGSVFELGFGAGKAFDSLLSIFEGTRPASPTRQVDTGSFESAAQEALKREREREDAEERVKHKELYRE
jgi:relaxase-like protein